MIERHLTFGIDAGQASPFETFFGDEYAPALRAFAGCLGVRLLREPQGGRYRLVSVFETEGAEKTWRASPTHAGLSPRIRAFLRDHTLEYFSVISGTQENQIRR
jgi:heme-degrading monooxygenase HmoA